MRTLCSTVFRLLYNIIIIMSSLYNIIIIPVHDVLNNRAMCVPFNAFDNIEIIVKRHIFP